MTSVQTPAGRLSSAAALSSVETQITNMLNKLGLNSGAQISRWIDRRPERIKVKHG